MRVFLSEYRVGNRMLHDARAQRGDLLRVNVRVKILRRFNDVRNFRKLGLGLCFVTCCENFRLRIFQRFFRFFLVEDVFRRAFRLTYVPDVDRTVGDLCGVC